jgi:superfamily II DNA or RNA helicase
MEKSSPLKDCFDEFDPNKYETVNGEFNSGDLVLYKSKIYIAKRNGSSSFIYASHSDMKANRKVGSPSKNSLTKIRPKQSKSPVSSPTNIRPSINEVGNTKIKSDGGITPQKLERNLMGDFEAKREPLREGDAVAILYQPIQKYFNGRVKSVQATTVTVSYVGYSDQATEDIRLEDVAVRLRKGAQGESGFKEGDLAILIEGEQTYHVVIKDMSDWIWVENYDKPEASDWIQVAGLKEVLSNLIKTDPATFYGYKPEERAIVEYNDAQHQCKVTSVTARGVNISVDGYKDEVLLNYQSVVTQLSKQGTAKIFRSNQTVDSSSTIITISGVGLTSLQSISLRTAAGPLDTFSIVDLSDTQIKMKVWDIVSDGKLEASGDYDINNKNVSTDYVTIAIVKKDNAIPPKVQLYMEDNWQIPYWKDLAAQPPLCHLKRGASWNVSAGKYGLYSPKMNWQKEKENYSRQNTEGSVTFDYDYAEQMHESQPVEVDAMFSLSTTTFNFSRLTNSTPPVIVTCNIDTFKDPVRVLLKTDNGKTLSDTKALLVTSRKISFKLPIDEILKVKPSTLNIWFALVDSPLRDSKLSMEFKENDGAFKEAELQSCRFPKEFNGQVLHLEIEDVTIHFSVPTAVYDRCKLHAGPFYVSDTYIFGANEAQMNDVKHWIFTPSHNRASKARLDYSAPNLKSSYTQVIVVRSGIQFEQYQQVWGSTHIIMALPLYFGAGNDSNGVGFARRIIMAVADKLNMKRIWLVDDNVHSFYQLNSTTKQYDKCHITTVLKGVEEMFSSHNAKSSEKYSPQTCLSLLPKGEYFDVYSDGPHSQNAIMSQQTMKARLEVITNQTTGTDSLIGSPNCYGVIGIARCGQFQHIYKKPFVRDQVYSCVLINLEAIRYRNRILADLKLPPIMYPEYPIFEDMKFNDICDFNGLWVVKSNRFLHKKVQTKEVRDNKKIEWRKYFVSSFDLYSKINDQILRLPFKTLNIRKFAVIGDLKYMIGQHPELGAKKYGKILRISSIAEHDNGLALGHSLKDSNIVAKVLHTDDEVLDEKTHKLYIEFEKACFDSTPTQKLYFDIQYGPPAMVQVFSPIAAIVVHGSLDANVQVELKTVPPLPKRMILPLSGKPRTAVFKNIKFDKAGQYKFIAEALQNPPLVVEAPHMTRVIDLEVKRSSEYFQQGLVLSVKLEECDMEVKRRYRSQHEFYEATWPAYRPRFVTTQGSHLRICQYLAYACYLSHVHKSKSNVAAVIKLPTGAGKTVLGCLLPFLAAKNKVLILTTSPLISREFKKALVGSRKRNEISMFERYKLLPPNMLPSVAIFKKDKETLKYMTENCKQANYIVCNYQKLTLGKKVRENGWLAMLSRLHIDMIIVDEAHHDAADSYQAIYNLFPGAKKILLTATPFRTDQKKLGGEDGAVQIFNYSIQDALKAKIIKDISHVTVRARNMNISSSLMPVVQAKKTQRPVCIECKSSIKNTKEMIDLGRAGYRCHLCHSESNNFQVAKKKNVHSSSLVNESSLVNDYFPIKEFTRAILGQKEGEGEDEKKRPYISPESIAPSVEILLTESLLKLHEKRTSSQSRVHHKIIVYCDSINDTITITKFYNEIALRMFKEKKLPIILKAAAFHSNPGSESKDRIEQHQIDVVVQSKMLGEGYDHKEFTIAVLVGSQIKSLSKYIQFVGRIMRRLANGDKLDNQALIFIHDGLQFEKLWQAYKDEDCEVSFERLSSVDTQYKITKEEHYLTFESLAQSAQSSLAYK